MKINESKYVLNVIKKGFVRVLNVIKMALLQPLFLYILIDQSRKGVIVQLLQTSRQ